MSNHAREKNSSDHSSSRRGFLKKTAYVAPVVLTLNALPKMAAANGSHDQVIDIIEKRLD